MSFFLDNKNVVNLSYRFGDIIYGRGRGRAHDRKQHIMSGAKRLWGLGRPLVQPLLITTTPAIFVPA